MAGILGELTLLSMSTSSSLSNLRNAPVSEEMVSSYNGATCKFFDFARFIFEEVEEVDSLFFT